MNKLWISIACLLFAYLCNDIEDTLAHHYDRSIFDQGHNSYLYPDWTRKYIDGDVEKGRKKIFWIIPIPAWCFDAWHLIKDIRWWMIFNSLWFMLMHFIGPYKKGQKKYYSAYIGFLIIYLISIQLLHIIFYENLLLK